MGASSALGTFLLAVIKARPCSRGCYDVHAREKKVGPRRTLQLRSGLTSLDTSFAAMRERLSMSKVWDGPTARSLGRPVDA